MKKFLKYSLLFFGIIFLSVIFCVFFGKSIFTNLSTWREVELIPDNKIVSISTTTIIPMGHIDLAIVLTDKNKLFILKGRNWKSLNESLPENEQEIVEIRYDYPLFGFDIYVKNNNKKFYKKTLNSSGEETSWEEVHEEDFLKVSEALNDAEREKKIEERRAKEGIWSRAKEPKGVIVDRASIYMSFSLSEEARNYVLMDDGKLNVLSRTHSLFHVFIHFFIGVFFGIVIFIFSVIFRKRISNFFKNIFSKLKIKKS